MEDEEADSEFWGQDFFAEEEREADWEKSGSEATDVPDSDFDMSVRAAGLQRCRFELWPRVSLGASNGNATPPKVLLSEALFTGAKLFSGSHFAWKTLHLTLQPRSGVKFVCSRRVT